MAKILTVVLLFSFTVLVHGLAGYGLVALGLDFGYVLMGAVGIVMLLMVWILARLGAHSTPAVSVTEMFFYLLKVYNLCIICLMIIGGICFQI